MSRPKNKHKRRLICKYCGKKCDTVGKLQYHKNNCKKKKLKIDCKICGLKVETLNGLGHHITKTHKITCKEYYDKYLKKIKEGTCIHCGNKTNFKNLKKGYFEYCSYSCVSKDEKTQKKMRQTCLKHYGVEKPVQNKKILNKALKTRIELYGELFDREKSKQTCLEKYGVENVFQAEEIKEKAKQTKLEKYNDQNYNNREKWRETCLGIYGTEHPMKNEKIKQKVHQTRLDRGLNNDFSKVEVRNYRAYSSIIRFITGKVYIKFINLIDPLKLRSKEFAVDHKYSIRKGFDNKIDIEIMCSPINLQILSFSENSRKYTSCSVSKDSLMKDYKNFIKTNKDFLKFIKPFIPKNYKKDLWND